MGLFDFLGSLFGGVAGGIGSIFGGVTKANAANDAANAQVNAGQQGLQTIQGLLGQQQQNQQPFLNAGTSSLNQLMKSFQDGTFGTAQKAPQFEGGTFSAPTLQEARDSPGYKFASEQGTNAILKGASAAGGAINGGTLQSLDSFNSGLADSTYSNVFNRAMSTYNEGLSKYQAQLQGFGAQLGSNQQAFNQLFAPAQLGENAANSLNNSESKAGEDIANLYTNQGNARAAGLVGSANALTGGVQSGISQLFGNNGGNLSGLLKVFNGQKIG